MFGDFQIACYRVFTSIDEPVAKVSSVTSVNIKIEGVVFYNNHEKRHISAFNKGQCTQTNFANVQLFIVVVEGDSFDLYLDRSHARYLSNWLHDSGEDPITRDSKFQAMHVN